MERMTPISSAAISAPVICPRPAVATTANDSTVMSVPAPGTSDVVGAASAPPSAPRMVAITNVT
ncbi:hypothetical protein D3C86_906050 [compost metagenome]